MGKMVNMARTKADVKNYDKPTVSSPDHEKYSYGTRISLDHNDLDKLGIDKLPKVGSAMHLKGKVRVHSASEEHSVGGKKRRRLELQIEHMGLHNGKDEPESAEEAVQHGIEEADEE